MHDDATGAHARAHGPQREVAGAAFYTHVTTLARQYNDCVVENRPNCIVDRKKTLIPITLPSVQHRRSTEYYHPMDPRRERQVARERNEFAIKWATKNQDGIDESPDEWKRDVYEVGEEKSNDFCENKTFETERMGETTDAITIDENEDASEVMSRTEPTGRKRSYDEVDTGRRRNADDHTRSSSGSKIEERSLKTSLRRDHGSPEAASILSTVVDDGESTGAKRSKITKDDSSIGETPELLDERVGYATPFIVRIPRTAITLNLNSCDNQNGASAKKDTAHARPPTEIRLADSSVPDLAANGNEEINVPVEKSGITNNKPKVVEDLTCLDGTILSSTSLKKFAKKSTDPTRKKGPPDTNEKSAEISVNDSVWKKSRINEKFRRLFGSDVTLSESDEESRITAKLTSRKRRNESRLSSDSGVCLSDQISDIISSEALEKSRENESHGEYPGDNYRKSSEENHNEYTRGNPREYTEVDPRECTEVNPRECISENPSEYPMECPREYSRERLGECPGDNLREKHKEYAGQNPREFTRENLRECLEEYPEIRPKKYLRERPKECYRENPSKDSRKISSMKKEDMDYVNVPVRSMPLLDADCDERAEEATGEALPDSSTGLFERISTAPDSSSGGKLMILVTPLNVQDSDAFGTLSLEVDLPEDTRISTPTSTTSGPPIGVPVKLKRILEGPESLVGTDIDKSCPIAVQDNWISIKDDLSPEADTESYDGDRLIIAENIDLGPDQTSTEPGATEESTQTFLGTTATVDEIPIETQWRPDSMIGSDKNLSNVTDINSSSNSNATAGENFDEKKDLDGPSLPVEKIPKSEASLAECEKIPKNLLSVTSASSEKHKKLLSISTMIVDIDPKSVLPVGPGQTVDISDEVSKDVISSESESARLEMENYIPESRPKKMDETIMSNNFAAKLLELTRDGCSMTGPKSDGKSKILDFEFEPNSLTPQRLEDRTKVPRPLGYEVSDMEIPKCVLDVEKPKDIPKAPSFRVLHPSELGSRWCPTPLVTDGPQNQSRYSIKPPMTQPPLYSPIRQLSPYTISVPQIQPQILSNSQILRYPSYTPVRQTPPEAFIQTPPSSPLEQMQFLTSQTSSSAPTVEDLSSKKSSGYVNVTQVPRLALTGNGNSPNCVADKIANTVSPMEKQQQFLMSRIFDFLLSMSTCIERIKRECDASTIHQLNRDFNAKRSCLFVELSRYAIMLGTSDLRTIVTRIMNYYNYRVPPERRILTVERVLYMLQLDHTTMSSTVYPAKPPPPPYRPTRTPVMQSSPFTEAQRQLLCNQMAAYNRLGHVLHYQLLAQRRAKEEADRLRSLEAAKPKRIRKRNRTAPTGKNRTVQAPIVGVLEQPDLSTAPELRRVTTAPVDRQSDLQQAIEFTIERILRSKGVEKITIPERRNEQTVELTVRDPSIDDKVADIVNDLYLQYPAERMAEGQTVERSFQGQFVKENPQGPTIGANYQGQRIDTNAQGQSFAKTAQFQAIEGNSRETTIERSAQCQTAERNFQGQTIERNFPGQTIEMNRRDVEKPCQGESIETNVQGQDIEQVIGVRSIEAKVQGQTIEKSIQFHPIEVNARDEAIEDNAQGRTIIEEDSRIESALNRSSSSAEDGNASVLDVLKELEILDSITEGPVSRVSKTLETTKSLDDEKLPDYIMNERGSKAANPTCPEDPPTPSTISTETAVNVDDEEAETHEESGAATYVDVLEGSSRTVPVITIDDDEERERASTNGVETVRDAEHVTIVDEFSILDVKSISKDVFNKMGEEVVDGLNSPTARKDDEPTDKDETEDECVVIETELSDCFQCGKRSEVVCGQCRLAPYCSPECHQKHWSATHHLTCEPVPKEIFE